MDMLVDDMLVDDMAVNERDDLEDPDIQGPEKTGSSASRTLCDALHLSVRSRHLNKTIARVGYTSIVFLTVTDIKNTSFSAGDKLTNLLGLTLINTSMNDMMLPNCLRSFTAIDCYSLRFLHKLPQLNLLHIENITVLLGIDFVRASPLDTVVFRSRYPTDSDSRYNPDIGFIKAIREHHAIPGLKYLTLSANFSNHQAAFLTWWPNLQYLQVGNMAFELKCGELQEATMKLTNSSTYFPTYTFGDIVFELSTKRL